MQLVLYQYPWRKGTQNPPFSEQISQGRGQEVWSRETAGRGEKGDYDEKS